MNMNVSAEAIFSDKIRLLDTIHYEDNPKGIITAVKLSDGQYHVLSRYEDSLWQLPHHWFPHGVQNGQKKLNFERIGTQKLRVAAKLIMARQLWGSETFSNRKAGKSYINLFDSITKEEIERVLTLADDLTERCLTRLKQAPKECSC